MPMRWFAARGLSAAAMPNAATSASETKLCRWSPAPIKVMGCCAINGMPTTMPIQISMKTDGHRMVYAIPLRSKAASQVALILNSGMGWPGTAP